MYAFKVYPSKSEAVKKIFLIVNGQVTSTNIKAKSDKSKNSVSCMKQTHNIGVMNRGLKQCMHGW